MGIYMPNSHFHKYYRHLASFVDSWLAAELPPGTALQQAMRYSATAGGKRFRPVLSLAVGDMLGLELEMLQDWALALECAHTASLIHDDLPALDNDTLRRGKPTCHVVFGENLALLAGDALNSQSFLFINRENKLPMAIRSKLSRLLAWATIEICDGQVMDLEASKQITIQEDFAPVIEESSDEKLLIKRHLKKTGALIQAASAGPAFLSIDETRNFAALKNFGEALGLLFQVTDDILDVTASTEKLGKNAASDEKRGLSTFVNVFGLEHAKELATQYYQQSLVALQDFGDKASFLKELARFVLKRES